MNVTLGTAVAVVRQTKDQTGNVANADALPTALVYRNGALDASVTVTVANPSTGRYRLSFTVPGGYSVADIVELEMTAVVGGTTVARTVGSYTVVGSIGLTTTDVASTLTSQGVTTARAARLDNLDAAVSTRTTGGVTLAAGQAVAPVTLAAGQNIAANNLPSDYQQRGQAVTLPASVLGAADHTAIQADVTGGLTAQGFTAARAAFLDTLNGLVASIWASTSRTLSAFGFAVAPTAAQVASAILATPANLLVTNASGQVQHDLTQAVPTTGAANSVSDCLNAARVQAFGKWQQQGLSLVLYNYDNTVAHTFPLDSATAPTQRG